VQTDRLLLQLPGWQRIEAILSDPAGRCAAVVTQAIELEDAAGAAYCRTHCRCAACVEKRRQGELDRHLQAGGPA
jgi:hypothetical protein